MEKKTKRRFDWGSFFVTVLGTAIGVALTFIVSGILERRSKAQAQRLTAIMVIHDIDNSIDIVKKMKEEEERNGELLRFALKQRDHLEGMPFDTLASVIDVLIDSRSVFSFDTSKEKIFNSDLDTWVIRYREQSINIFKEMADKGEKRTVKASMDSSNDKMEWTESDGTVRYLKRKEE